MILFYTMDWPGRFPSRRKSAMADAGRGRSAPRPAKVLGVDGKTMARRRNTSPPATARHYFLAGAVTLIETALVKRATTVSPCLTSASRFTSGPTFSFSSLSSGPFSTTSRVW